MPMLLRGRSLDVERCVADDHHPASWSVRMLTNPALPKPIGWSGPAERRSPVPDDRSENPLPPGGE